MDKATQNIRRKTRLTNEEVFQKIVEFYNAQGQEIDMNTLFNSDRNRFNKFSARLETPEDGTILVDYSKNLVTSALLEKLIELAEDRGVEEARDDMMSGKKVNTLEKKPVLHNSLRMADFKKRENKLVVVDKYNIVQECEEFLEKMYLFVNSVHANRWKGCHGKKFTDVIVMGHGGFTVASQMVTEALTPFNKGLKIHYVTNVDGTALAEIVKNVVRCRVLFVIISHDFDDPDVIQNATAAKNWFLRWTNKGQMAKHFVAVTSHKPNAVKFGIDPGNIFRYGEYVGECYSVWSTIGLPVALSIGTKDFAKFLEGARYMDDHFRSTPLESNVPVILAMIGIWYINFYQSESHAILPYDQYLRKFPNYVGLLDMKSNGKINIGRGMSEANFETGTVTWGEAGTNGQHSFYQLLHQGTRLIPCDFIIPALSHNPIEGNKHHKILVSNFLAQSEALMRGRNEEEVLKDMAKSTKEEIDLVRQHRIFSGNRPSNSIVLKMITPFTLGALMALYEHKAFVQSVVWDVDPFVHPIDELNKILSNRFLECLDDPRKTTIFDSSTNSLMTFIKRKMEVKSWRDYGLLAYEATTDPPIAEFSKRGEVFSLVTLSAMLFFWYKFFSKTY